METSNPRPDRDAYAQLIGPFPRATTIVGTRYAQHTHHAWQTPRNSGTPTSNRGLIVAYKVTEIPHPVSRALLSTSYHLRDIEESVFQFSPVHTPNLSVIHLYATRQTDSAWSSLLGTIQAKPLLLVMLRFLDLGHVGASVNDFGKWITVLQGVPLLDLRVSIGSFQRDFLLRLSREIPTLEHLRLHSSDIGCSFEESIGDLLSSVRLPKLRELDLKVPLLLRGSPQYTAPPPSRQPNLPIGRLQKLSILLLFSPSTSLLYEALCLSQYIPSECRVDVIPWPAAINGPHIEQWSDLLAKERRALSCARMSGCGWLQLSKEGPVKF